MGKSATIDGLRKFRQRLLRERDPWHDTSRRFRVRRFAGPECFIEHLKDVRVAHLTDLHVGRVTPMAVQYDAVSMTNAGKPDIVVISGDFVCHSRVYLDDLTEVIGKFDAPVFAVLGNHDHWAGADVVRKALRKGGAEVLDNAHTTITIGHQPLQVLGLDDAYTGHASQRDALKGLKSNLPVIGLSHIAEEADALWEHGVPLVFSGHTHAGQITVARLHELSVGKLAGHKYIHGLYGSRAAEEPKGAVYVGAGVGAAIVPLRLGERARREVAFFELGVQPGAFDEHHQEQAAHRGRKPSPKTKERRAQTVLRKQERRARRNGNGAGPRAPNR
ncbi:MAG: metallophosphoesterase [Deltaproteobacteria bacterium]|nr:metallophosphoesterase [Deltaproteobacteria bacterium]